MGISALGLAIGMLCLGRAVEAGLQEKGDRTQRTETISAGLAVGFSTTVGALWMLRDSERSYRTQKRLRELSQHKHIACQRLQSIFYKALKANEGRINAIQLALVGQISLTDAQVYLETWANLLGANAQADSAGVTLYCFDLSKINDSQTNISESNV